MDDQTDTILVATGMSLIALCFLTTICMVLKSTYCERDFNENFLDEVEHV